ncbi:restriction endonuclease subunit S [Heyndrickxia coagulans]|uniref:restriction endonuclease subunit S n=1 Tax=Heyndrickxia coagulans TaxID=1398 RepID=UPI0022355B1B|nr:restriction endonuclease subunit S [Heyndrickxia coagulans]UZH05824.1 restriction endonuclease subunit S [Heyndrickxia coagulans]
MRKKQKTMEELLEEALVPEEEQPYEVPGNWVWTKLGKIANYHNGKAFKPTDWSDKGRPIIRIQDLTGTNKGEPHFFEGQIDKKHEIKSGDLLISWSATLGAYIWKGEEAVLNQHIFKVESFINKKYHYYLMQNLISSLYSKTHGSGMVHVTKKVFDEIPVPLPNLKEQKRIADKVEHLLSKIDEAKRLIEEAKETFELRRAAILDKAFRGEMMEKSHISRESNANLYEIPINWKWKTFGDVAQVCSNLVDPKQYLELPHIAPDNIEKGTGQLLEYQTIEESKVKSPKHYFKKGQILYSKIRPYLSKVIIAEFEGLCSADMYPIETDLDAKYLFWYMLSPFFVEKASTAGSRSVLPKINKKELGNIPIPVPPKETQKKIVRIIESALSREKQTIGYLESIVGLMEKLKQSILSKAFRGELGTNDPTEESAIELLKEVLQEQVK